MRLPTALPLLLWSMLVAAAFGQSPPAPAPATQPATTQSAGKLPFLDVDVKHKRVRLECESTGCTAPLEFFCCVTGTNDYESVLRSKVKPSHLHLALLMIGLEPGQGVHYDPAAQKLIPPSGSPLKMTCEFEKNGRRVTVPAEALMRDVKSKKPAPKFTWVFAGSRVMNGQYAGDQTGYLVSVVNFDLTVIDVAAIASSANETLEWETNFDVCPPKDARVTLIIEPAAQAAGAKP